MAQVQFRIDVSRILDTYGLSVKVTRDDSGVIPVYLLVFSGPKERDPQDVAKQFSECHSHAMDKVGLTGTDVPVREDEFDDLVSTSIELASGFMQDYGFKLVPNNDVDEHILAALFEDDEPKEDPYRLN